MVLDDGANALGRAKRSYERIYVLHRDGCERSSAEAREAFADRRGAMQDVRYADDRIAIRLGANHVVRRAFAACAETLDQQRDFAHSYERGMSSADAIAQQRCAHEKFDPSREAFVEAARQLIGPRLD